MATEGRDWLLPVSRGPRQHRSAECLRATAATLVVAYAPTPQPATCAVGSGRPNFRSLDPSTTRSGTEKAFEFTETAGKDMGEAVGAGTEKGAKVAVYYTEESGKKIAHFFGF